MVVGRCWVGYYLCFGELDPGRVLWICLPPSAAGLCEFGLLQNERGDLWMVELCRSTRCAWRLLFPPRLPLCFMSAAAAGL